MYAKRDEDKQRTMAGYLSLFDEKEETLGNPTGDETELGTNYRTVALAMGEPIDGYGGEDSLEGGVGEDPLADGMQTAKVRELDNSVWAPKNWKVKGELKLEKRRMLQG